LLIGTTLPVAAQTLHWDARREIVLHCFKRLTVQAAV